MVSHWKKYPIYSTNLVSEIWSQKNRPFFNHAHISLHTSNNRILYYRSLPFPQCSRAHLPPPSLLALKLEALISGLIQVCHFCIARTRTSSFSFTYAYPALFHAPIPTCGIHNISLKSVLTISSNSLLSWMRVSCSSRSRTLALRVSTS